jgi:hypothetical protein
LDLYLEGRSHHEQFQLAGNAIQDIAEVCYQWAERLIQNWEDRYSTEEPVLDEDFLAGMVQQTMHLDLSGLCRQPKSLKKGQGFADQPVKSVVVEVSKEDVLEFVNELESEEAIALCLVMWRMCRGGRDQVDCRIVGF